MLLAIAATGLAVGPLRAPAARRTTLPTMGLHDLTATTIDGAELSMSELAGAPVLMCNVASR